MQKKKYVFEAVKALPYPFEMCEEVVQVGDHCMAPLPHADSLVSEVADLLGQSLAVHPKQTTLPRNQEVNRSYLHGTLRQMNLEKKIKKDFIRLLNNANWCRVKMCCILHVNKSKEKKSEQSMKKDLFENFQNVSSENCRSQILINKKV